MSAKAQWMKKKKKRERERERNYILHDNCRFVCQFNNDCLFFSGSCWIIICMVSIQSSTAHTTDNFMFQLSIHFPTLSSCDFIGLRTQRNSGNYSKTSLGEPKSLLDVHRMFADWRTATPPFLITEIFQWLNDYNDYW